MSKHYSVHLTDHLSDYKLSCKLPLYVKKIAKGTHPENAPHDHDFTEIVIVTCGECFHKVAGKSVQIAKGDVLLIYQGITHSYSDVKTMGITNLLYRPEAIPLPFLDSYEFPNFELLFPIRKGKANSEAILRPIAKLNNMQLKQMTGLLSLLSQELKRKNPGASFYSLGLFMQILTLIGRSSLQKTSPSKEIFWLNGILSYMKDHFKENLKVSKLAELAHVSERAFFYHFKKLTGYSPHRYQVHLRLQHAVKLLQNSSMPVTQIAMESGFFDNGHMTREFQRTFRCSPKVFRQKAQKGSETRTGRESIDTFAGTSDQDG